MLKQMPLWVMRGEGLDAQLHWDCDEVSALYEC